MAQSKYKPQVEREPAIMAVLEEELNRRRYRFTEKLSSMCSQVYSSGDLKLIERFENLVYDLSGKIRPSPRKSLDAAVEGEQPVRDEVKVEREAPRISRSGKGSRKPKLTFYRYTLERDQGRTNDDIKDRYTLNSPKQLSGFGRQYARNKAQ